LHAAPKRFAEISHPSHPSHLSHLSHQILSKDEQAKHGRSLRGFGRCAPGYPATTSVSDVPEPATDPSGSDCDAEVMTPAVASF
jgi:hypothetical protein